MRYIGFDLGTKTLGVALSDITKTIANPLKTIHFNENEYNDVIEEIKILITEYKVEVMILGLPKNMNNTIGESGERTFKFKELLEENFNIPVIMQDERLSTVEAHNYLIEADMSRKKRKNKIDGLAASIILQTYLNKEKGKKI